MNSNNLFNFRWTLFGWLFPFDRKTQRKRFLFTVRKRFLLFDFLLSPLKQSFTTWTLGVDYVIECRSAALTFVGLSGQGICRIFVLSHTLRSHLSTDPFLSSPPHRVIWSEQEVKLPRFLFYRTHSRLGAHNEESNILSTLDVPLLFFVSPLPSFSFLLSLLLNTECPEAFEYIIVQFFKV